MTVASNLDKANLVSMFFEQVDREGEAPFLWAKHDGKYSALTWREVAAQVSELARGLRAIGVEPGDRVVIVSENRPEWLIADLGIMAIGAITVPAYITNTVADHTHILENSGARVVIVSTPKLAERLLPAAVRSSSLKAVIAMATLDIDQDLGVDLHAWKDVLARGAEGHDNLVEESLALDRKGTACIIYTSGTGGAPKGVMLDHAAIICNCKGAMEALQPLGLDDNLFLSFLPLSHSYEHSAGQFFPISIAAQIYYAEGIETLASNMIEVRPTIMTAVPRLYETLHSRITMGVRKQGGKKEALFNKAVELGTKKLTDPNGLSLVENLQNGILSVLVRKKVKARFGGRLKTMVSGGAPLNPDVGMFFLALGLRIMQGYGLTESAPVISVNRPFEIKIDTVGRPLVDVQVHIADDGEILVRGDLVMQGYWQNEAATAEAIRDGWLHTGDIGHLDDKGRLVITDRKKDIIVNSGGDNIAPQRVEGILALEPEIAQAMAYGDKRSHLVALLVPDPEWMAEWARENGKSANQAELAGDADFHKALGVVIERNNARLSNIEKIRRFIIADEPFTIDGGLMTPTLKIRRNRITELYGEKLQALYR